jgi:hypothetical protein
MRLSSWICGKLGCSFTPVWVYVQSKEGYAYAHETCKKNLASWIMEAKHPKQDHVPPFCDWGLWMFAQTSVFFLHDYGISLVWGYERVKGSPTFCRNHFPWPINFNYISKDAGNFWPCDFLPSRPTHLPFQLLTCYKRMLVELGSAISISSLWLAVGNNGL